MLVTEGVLIGCGDLRYLLSVHCLNFVVLGSVLWVVKATNAGLQAIWMAVLLNQTMRQGHPLLHLSATPSALFVG